MQVLHESRSMFFLTDAIQMHFLQVRDCRIGKRSLARIVVDFSKSISWCIMWQNADGRSLFTAGRTNIRELMTSHICNRRCLYLTYFRSWSLTLDPSFFWYSTRCVYTQKSGFLFVTQYISWLLYLYHVLGLRTLRLNQDRVFLYGVHLPQSKENMYLFQEHSAIENIKYILSLDWQKCNPSKNPFF